MISIESKLDIPEYIKTSIQSLLKTVFDFDIEVIVKKKTKKRSLDSNAYYWRLVAKLAEINDITKPCQHNMLLRDYGQIQTLDGQLLRIPIPDTEIAENEALEASTYHIKPTSDVRVGKDGVTYRTYFMLKGSSEYDTKEMFELIKGLIMECRQVGMSEGEIMSPREKAQFEERYGVDFEKTNESYAV